jgi:phospholipid/cholesterol/gamma-HCH transport system permease protein
MRQHSPKPVSPDFAVNDGGKRLTLEGVLDVHTLQHAKLLLTQQLKTSKTKVFDLGKLGALDSTGALLLCGLREQGVELTGARAEHQRLLDLVCGLKLATLPKPAQVPRWRQLVINLGKGADDVWRDAYAVIAFVALAANATGRVLLQWRRLPLPSISRHVAETGIDALPIVALMAVMISIVIGYQGVAQLRPYGGEEFTVNLVAVSMLREMGVLVTSIMVAGRSGSAFAAEIGVMRVREEIDAMSVMGMDPMEMLVVPRLLALVITLPLLTFFSDLMGLAGGAAIAAGILDITPLQYLSRVHSAVSVDDLTVGLVKAPVFAILIALVGCMHGLRVSSSAESVGRETTRAVVKAIFLVIVLDALFSILFERLGV